MKTHITALALIALATSALAHSGVKNHEVMARMNLMTQIADDMKILGAIAKGTSPFDAAVVTPHATNLEAHARQIEVLFKSKATDPKSEATDNIWTDWPGFSQDAQKMEDAAMSLGQTDNLAGFQAAFGALGKTCSACHETYRIKK